MNKIVTIVLISIANLVVTDRFMSKQLQQVESKSVVGYRTWIYELAFSRLQEIEILNTQTITLWKA